HRRRAVLGLDEVHDALEELAHDLVPFVSSHKGPARTSCRPERTASTLTPAPGWTGTTRSRVLCLDRGPGDLRSRSHPASSWGCFRQDQEPALREGRGWLSAPQ